MAFDNSANKESSSLKRFIYIAGGNQFRQVAVFVSNLVLARALGADLFGMLTFAVSIYTMMSGVGDFGARLYCWRMVATSRPAERPLRTLQYFISRTIVATAVSVVSILIIEIVARGTMRPLLLGYAVAIVFSQAAFDWIFLSTEKEFALFLFNALSGLIYVTFICLFSAFAIHHLETAESILALIPGFQAFSYFVPAALLVCRNPDLRREARALHGLWGRLPKIIFTTVRGSALYASYDLLQRFYQIAIFVFAWLIFSKSVIGQFRLVQLLFAYAGIFAIYLGSTYFNQIARAQSRQEQMMTVRRGLLVAVVLFVPLTFVGADVLSPIIRSLFGREYFAAIPALRVLMLGISLPVIGNFLREVGIAAGMRWLSNLSYLAVIIVIALMVSIRPSTNTVYLSLCLVIAECAGIIVLLFGWRSRSEFASLAKWVLGCLAVSLALHMGYVILAARSSPMDVFKPLYMMLVFAVMGMYVVLLFTLKKRLMSQHRQDFNNIV